MRIFGFAEHHGRRIDQFGSDFILSPLTQSRGAVRTAFIHLAAGSEVGEHEAATGQLFCVVRGEGWVSGGDGVRRRILPHQAAYWAAGERHAAGTESGLGAVVLEGDALTVGATPLHGDD